MQYERSHLLTMRLAISRQTIIGGVWRPTKSGNQALASPFCCRDEPTSLLALRPQLPPGVPAEEGFHPGGHLQTGRVPLETGAGKRPDWDVLWNGREAGCWC